MSKRKNLYLEKSLLEGLDQIIKKIDNLQAVGYDKWNIDRTDLVKFAIASTYGLLYPYIYGRTHRLKKALRELKKSDNKK